MPAQVLVTHPLPDPFREVLEGQSLEVIGDSPATSELCRRLTAMPPDALCTQLADPVNDEVLAAAGSRLRVVANYAVGFNNIDVAAATARGIAVTNTPGVLTDATADLAMALLLGVARRLHEGDNIMRQGSFDSWRPDYMLGLDLRDQLLGIIGFGRIGQAVARRAKAFGMRIAYVSRRTPQLDSDLSDAVSLPLDQLLVQSDFVSVHCPLTDDTRHLIDAAALAKMKPTAVLINTSRGPVVDEVALTEALQAHKIFGAGLDVYENEPALAPGLAECENTLLAPHVGSATVRTRAAMAELVADNVLAALRGELPPNCLNPMDFSWLGNPA